MIALFAAIVLASPAFDVQIIPKARADIATACSASPTIVVAWDTFGNDTGAADALMSNKLSFLTAAFQKVCQNPALKPEVRKQISKVTLSQAYGAPDPMIYILKGTLHIEYLWAKGEPAPDVAFVANELAARLRGEEAEAP